MRQLRRGGGAGRAVPVILSRRHHPQPDRIRSVHGEAAQQRHRFPAAPPRPAPSRLGLREHRRMNLMLQPSVIDQTRPISIAVLAMGGQGGGVLVDWIVALAESEGWIAQSTSVPGVAQRTGATIY